MDRVSKVNVPVLHLSHTAAILAGMLDFSLCSLAFRCHRMSLDLVFLGIKQGFYSHGDSPWPLCDEGACSMNGVGTRIFKLLMLDFILKG